MTQYDLTRVSEVLQEADKQVNIYDGSSSHIELYNLPVVLDTPEDWLAWMIHDSNMHEQMAQDEKYTPFDLACFWEDAALLRRYAIELLLLGVEASEIDWNPSTTTTTE